MYPWAASLKRRWRAGYRGLVTSLSSTNPDLFVFKPVIFSPKRHQVTSGYLQLGWVKLGKFLLLSSLICLISQAVWINQHAPVQPAAVVHDQTIWNSLKIDISLQSWGAKPPCQSHIMLTQSHLKASEQLTDLNCTWDCSYRENHLKTATADAAMSCHVIVHYPWWAHWMTDGRKTFKKPDQGLTALSTRLINSHLHLRLNDDKGHMLIYGAGWTQKLPLDILKWSR